MGATTFTQVGKGINASMAFVDARQSAQFDHGHMGYTGTIAEKSGFVLIPRPDGKDAYDYAEELIDADDPRISDKWGPAGCIKIREDEYLFFGWASC